MRYGSKADPASRTIQRKLCKTMICTSLVSLMMRTAALPSFCLVSTLLRPTAKWSWTTARVTAALEDFRRGREHVRRREWSGWRSELDTSVRPRLGFGLGANAVSFSE